MGFARHSLLTMILAAVLGPAVASGQVMSTAARSAAGVPTPTKTPLASQAKTSVLPAPPGNTTGASNPVQGAGALPAGPPPFALSEIYYFEPATGTKYTGVGQGTTWMLPVVDTLKTWSVTFLFDSTAPKQEIAEIVEKKACCAALLVSGQSVPVSALSFAGNRVFVRATVPNMQSWPKTIQLRLFHEGITASPADAGRASATGGGGAPA